MTTSIMCLFLKQEHDLWPQGGLGLLLGPLWTVLAALWTVLGRAWPVLGSHRSPLTPPAASEQTTATLPSPPFFDLKPLLTSLHFFFAFFFRLGSLLGSLLEPFGRPSWPKFGPSCLLTPYFFENMNFQKNEPRPRREHDFGDRSGPRSSQDGSKIASRQS